MTMFSNPEESHKHSFETLKMLYEYDDFMASIRTVIDLGCGSGLDLEWWASATTRDEVPRHLNINCTGVDLAQELPIARKYPNINYQPTDFEGTINTPKKSKYDVLWSHDSFQYAVNPLQTLNSWWNIASDNAMLVIIVPQTVNIQRNQISFYQPSNCYYHYSIVSLIHMLAVTGWDCKNGFFLKRPQSPWLHAVVYKSEHKPMDPAKTNWHTLSEMGLLPDSADRSVYAHGELYQPDLVLPWLDHSLTDMNQQ